MLQFWKLEAAASGSAAMSAVNSAKFGFVLQIRRGSTLVRVSTARFRRREIERTLTVGFENGDGD